MNANDTPDTVPAPSAVLAATVLAGHVSEATAYVVADYPYGFRLRCQIRYWIETAPGKGQRMVSQTSNPKAAGLVWNKPKKSMYTTVLVMALDGEGHVTTHGLSQYNDEAAVDAFAAEYAAALTSERDQKALNFLRAVARAQKRVTVTIHDPQSGRPVQSLADQQAIMRGIVGQELRGMAAGKGPALDSHED